MDWINKIIVISTSCLLFTTAMALDFSGAVRMLENHNSLKEIEGEAKGIEGLGDSRSSFGDPMIKVMAKNIPRDSLKRDETPMSGIDFSLSQKISLSGKYGAIGESFSSLRQSVEAKRSLQKTELLNQLWIAVIKRKELETKRTISSSSKNWVERQIKVSERLYANGKIPQQALLELKVRKADLESKIIRLSYSIREVKAMESYLLGKGHHVDLATVPWGQISIGKGGLDFAELSLQRQLKSKELALSASKRGLVPDFTFSFTYTLRENIDGNGDFVGAGVSFPLPFSGSKYSQIKQSVGEKYRSHYKLENYRERKRSTLTELKLKRERIGKELTVLRRQSIPFSTSSRDISARSYVRGGVSYSDLLLAEIKLEKLLETEASLIAEERKTIINYKTLAGEKLHES